MLTVDALAQEIRRIDGGNSLGAGALAEALMPFLEATGEAKPVAWALVSKTSGALSTTIEKAVADQWASQSQHSDFQVVPLYAAPVAAPDVPATEGCRCQGCGLLYRGDLIIPDDVWERIKPEGKPKGGGLLCPSCIMHRIVTSGIWSAARCVDIDALPAAVPVVKALRWPPQCPRGQRVYGRGAPFEGVEYCIAHYGGSHGDDTVYRWAAPKGKWSEPFDGYEAAQAAASRIADLERQLAEARKALEPFARVSSLFDHMNDDGGSVMVNIHLSDLRAARRALEGDE